MLNRTFIPFPVLKTERFILRQLEINDGKEIFSLRSDVEINKYIGRQLANTIDDAMDFIHNINENSNKNESLYWAITLNGKSRLVGIICLFSFSEENDKCEIGYELLTEFQGQGIMKEAVQKVLDFAFNTLKVRRIEAFIHRDNQRSIKLLENCTFKDSNEPDKADPDLIGYHLINSMYNLK